MSGKGHRGLYVGVWTVEAAEAAGGRGGGGGGSGGSLELDTDPFPFTFRCLRLQSMSSCRKVEAGRKCRSEAAAAAVEAGAGPPLLP